MRRKRKQRFIVVVLILTGIGVSVGLTLKALEKNINLFFSPSQIASGEAPGHINFRVGGMVVIGSVERDPDNLEVTFDLTDTAEAITVAFTGILPDLFREGQGIVAFGSMQGDRFIADQVLAKHDENYMSPEVSEALKAANRDNYMNTDQGNDQNPIKEPIN